MSLEEGDKAPDFDCEATDDKKVTLSGLRGKRIVLYFYPKDNTPGCTKESCAFQADLPNITRLNTIVLGMVSSCLRSYKSSFISVTVDKIIAPNRKCFFCFPIPGAIR